jgi:hemolysin-activating ACP:hemolysin acyltransferase
MHAISSQQPVTPAEMTRSPKPRYRPGEIRRERFAQSFSNIVAVLMRDPAFRNMRLAELESLVLPAVMSGQFRLAQSAEPGSAKAAGAKPGRSLVVPVAVALWASVSPEIDKRLSEGLDKPPSLRPTEWASGDNIWMVAIAGDPRAVPKFLKHLTETEFKDRKVKLRASGRDGNALSRRWKTTRPRGSVEQTSSARCISARFAR